MTAATDGLGRALAAGLARTSATLLLHGQDSARGANALHRATYMPTKIVASPISSIADGVRATARLLTAPEFDKTTGRNYNCMRDLRVHEQAYDLAARSRRRDLSERLTAAGGTS